MNKYENSLKQLTWFSRDYDNKQDDVKLCEEACTKAELFDIIIAKNIRTHLIKICDNYECYNFYFENVQNHVTEEEFEKLKGGI